MKPHSLVLSFIGACLLWVGWFGFNAGSALKPPVWPPALLWPRTSAPRPRRWAGWSPSGCSNGKPSVLGGILGRVAGLVAITPASGFVKPFPALLIGLLAGVVCFLMVTAVKNTFGYDDTLDAFGVHGAGGTLGALLTGVFATNADQRRSERSPASSSAGLVDGNPAQVLNQAHRRGHRLGARHRRHVGYPQDLRCWRSACAYREQETRGSGSQHARRRRILLRSVIISA